MTRLPELSHDDLAHLAAAGIPETEARRQLEQLVDPPPPTRVERPCRPGDGITRLRASDGEALEAAWRESGGERTMLKFVPASGAATRMFQTVAWWRDRDLALDELEREADAGSEPARQALVFARGLDRLPFHDRLRERLGTGEPAALLAGDGRRQVLDCLLGADGLDLARRPKGLLEFHRYPDGARTALEEHVLEGAGYLGADGPARLHLTVGTPHRAAFRALFERRRDELEARAGRALALELSEQEASTDTLALDEAGRPLRDSSGRLVLRPSGHGALIGNVARLDVDLAFVKNVDNVAHQRLWPLVAAWKRRLAGHLTRIEARCRELAARLERGEDAAAEALEMLQSELALRAPAAAAGGEERLRFVRRRLARPLRVCGVVPAARQPGGGPFWVRGEDGGLYGQIVEAAQIDREDGAQVAHWREATHFNPVDVVCALTGADGRRHDLGAQVDPAAAFVARKSHGGRPIVALERPGLWNGAMAGWNTAFVEVPAETFTPVKSVVDLLAPPHQPPAG